MRPQADDPVRTGGRRRALGFLATVLAVAASVAAAPARGAAQAPATAIDDLGYADDAAARAAWQPMDGVAPVGLAEQDGRRALRMPCNFAGTKIERASWDRAVRLDMAACQGLRFRLFCRDASPVAGFSLYFQSGDGWYASSFSPAVRDGWSTIVIDKDDTRIEGRPAGWSQVRTIRISAWRGADRDTEFLIRDLALVGEDAAIVIVRAESVLAKSPREAESVSTFTRGMAQALRDVGLASVILSDLDVTEDRLKGRKVVILPHNPDIAAPAAAAIRGFLASGGKMAAFYGLPGGLGDEVGVAWKGHVSEMHRGQFASIRFAEGALAGAPPVVGQRSWNVMEVAPVEGRSRVLATWFGEDGKSTGLPAVLASDSCIYMTHVLLDDDPVAKRRMLLAMLGRLVPDLWKEAVAARSLRAGTLGRYDDFAKARAAVGALAGGNTAAKDALDAARKDHRSLSNLAGAGKFPEALAKADDVDARMLEAACLAQTPAPGEHRAFWCHGAFGVDGMTWDEAIKHLADNGFTAILPNMCWGGSAAYESRVLPVAPEVKDKGDQIALCAAACRKYGLECHVWKVNWNLFGRGPKDFRDRMRRDGRTQVGFDGKPEADWLCPSHPENQRLEIDAMVEIATKYDVDGIHFDYIRYPDADYCFCAGCRERFEKTLGRKVANWPADVRRDEDLRGKWLDFRRSNITAVVAAVSETVRKARPKVKISAAVFPNWPVDRDGIGQDWKLWCDRGYLDFVCPMDYTPSTAEFEGLVERQVAWAGKVPCYPGIGLSVWSPACDVLNLVDKVAVTRRYKTGGFTVFQYAGAEAREVLPLLGKGLTRKGGR